MELPAQTELYDSADYLDSEEAVLTYLQVAFEEGDADESRAALNALARANGMTGPA
jgi:probable addiction module antidote protein